MIKGCNEIGTLKKRTTHEIHDSFLSVGCETIDRGYADYEMYKEFVPLLGVKRARLQTGWARFEKSKGEYDFSWYDTIVDHLVASGVKPWLNLMYGNPIYENGGGATLEIGGMPTGEEALLAWNSWVAAMVSRYKDRVSEWEVWNEPDLRGRTTGTEYGAFFELTAETVRKVDPNAVIIGLSIASIGDLKYITEFFDYLQSRGKLGLIDIMSLHGYPLNPDGNMKTYELAKTVAQKYVPDIGLWCGECGAPSKTASFGALSDLNATEEIQAKWDIRRAVWLISHGYLYSVFTMTDLHYPDRINYKGLLETNEDMSVKRPKLAFHSFNHVASVFDDRLTPVEKQFSSWDELEMQLYTYNGPAGNLLVYWDCSKPPVSETVMRSTCVKLADFDIDDPVIVDMLTGKVYEPDKSKIARGKGYICFEEVPICDYPIAISQRGNIFI